MALVVVTDDRLELRAPYHLRLSHRCRALGGRWKGADVGWVFERNQEKALRAVCWDLFALDGREESLQETIDLEVTVDEKHVRRTVFEANGSPIAFVGREIVAPLPRRDVARTGRGVKFLSGRPVCRHSVETYMLSISNGSVFTVQRVPRMTLERFIGSIGDAGSVRVV